MVTLEAGLPGKKNSWWPTGSGSSGASRTGHPDSPDKALGSAPGQVGGRPEGGQGGDHYHERQP